MGYRKDYEGGNLGDGFYLKNCGFSNETTAMKTLFERPLKNIKPLVDFSKLP
ncbi:hypothetical protein [Lacihabitans sp. CCS-44]|uniref:hypothetical protein n=1 Tax=Lacihabitans sp. CCS-44 TaxID=2487331 RepID=UPI0038F78AC2